MSKEESPLYVRLEYPEAVRSKKETLSSELSLINFQKVFQSYTLLREKESMLKMKFYKELKKVSVNIKKLRTLLPELKIPKILKPEERHTEIKDKDERDIENQLKEIQEKLKALSA
jgi:hypothetical protein